MCASGGCIVYKKNQMSTDRESGRGNKRARVTRGSLGDAWVDTAE
jgi:hypothetical protein